MACECLGIVGVGMIGASIGLSLRQREQRPRIIGVGRSLDRLEVARQMGAIDEGATEIAALKDCDFVVVCTPVGMIASTTLAIAPLLGKNAVITDAGSTKRTIVAAVDSAWSAVCGFIGSHPIAGSERRGPESGAANLFEGRLCVLTPTPATRSDAVERATAFWESLGMRVVQKSPEEHDDALARTSHLPHLSAAALAMAILEEDRPFIGTGFRDATRIAAGDPSIWVDIFRNNQVPMVDAIDRLQKILGDFKLAILNDDITTVERLLANAKRNRDALGNQHPSATP